MRTVAPSVGTGFSLSRDRLKPVATEGRPTLLPSAAAISRAIPRCDMASTRLVVISRSNTVSWPCFSTDSMAWPMSVSRRPSSSSLRSERSM